MKELLKTLIIKKGKGKAAKQEEASASKEVVKDSAGQENESKEQKNE